MSNTYDIMLLSSKLENALLDNASDNRSGAIDQMPWITLPPGYSFKVTFPFNGAAARFRVCKTENPSNDISVYLDTQYVLGYFGMPGEKPIPYWEAYPIGGDTGRFALNETKELIDAIIKELETTQSDIGAIAYLDEALHPNKQSSFKDDLQRVRDKVFKEHLETVTIRTGCKKHAPGLMTTCDDCIKVGYSTKTSDPTEPE